MKSGGGEPNIVAERKSWSCHSIVITPLAHLPNTYRDIKPSAMSRAQHLLSIARSFPPSPLKAPGTPQLSDALEKIITRTFPQSTGAAPGAAPISQRLLGPSEEKAMERMIGSLERIQSNASLKQVSCARECGGWASLTPVPPLIEYITARP